MKRAPLCPYHQGIFDRGLGRTPHTRMTKNGRRRRAWAIHAQCLHCQGKPTPTQQLPRDPRQETR